MQVPNLQFNVPPMIQLPNEMQGFTDALLQASQTRQQRLLDEQARAEMREQREFDRDIAERGVRIQEGQFGLAQERAGREAQLFEPQLQAAQNQAQLSTIQTQQAQEQQIYEQGFAQRLQEVAPQLQELPPNEQIKMIANMAMDDPAAPAASRLEAAERLYQVAKEESSVEMQQAKFELDKQLAQINMKVAESKLRAAEAAANAEQIGLSKDQQNALKIQYDHIQKNRIDPLHGELKSIKEKSDRLQMYANQLETIDETKLASYVQNNPELLGMMGPTSTNVVDRKAVMEAMKESKAEMDRRAKQRQAELDRVLQDQERLIAVQSSAMGVANFVKSPYEDTKVVDPEVVQALVTQNEQLVQQVANLQSMLAGKQSGAISGQMEIMQRLRGIAAEQPQRTTTGRPTGPMTSPPAPHLIER